MPRMTKATLNDAHADTGDGTPTSAARNERPPQVFDERGRTIPWMARTMHRLYNAQAQKILDEENVTIAHWIYLRVLAERGEIEPIGIEQTCRHGFDHRRASSRQHGKARLAEEKARSEGPAQILRRAYRQGAAFGR